MKKKSQMGYVALFSGALFMSVPAAAETINAVYTSDSSFLANFGFNPATGVSLAGNAAVDGVITAATNQIASQFSNNATVNILYEGIHAGQNSFLAASTTGQTVYSYGAYTAALAADAAANPGNTILNTAVANFGAGNGANNPNAFVVASTANARAIGLNQGVSIPGLETDATPEYDSNGNFVGGNGTVDGIIFLNLDQPLSFTRPIQPVSDGVVFDAQRALEHETDEILGIGGTGSELNNFNADPNYAIDDWGVAGNVYGTLDLYRYSAPGTPTFDPTTPSLSTYFSVDGGATSIDTFNQLFPIIGGDAGDWGLDLSQNCPGGAGFGGTGDVQDAFSCNNLVADVAPGTPSFEALEAVGYDPVPEPGSWAILAVGLAGLTATQLRRRKAI